MSVSEFCELRSATLRRTPGFADGPAARARLAAFHEQAREHGLVHEVVRRGDRAVAQLMCFRDPDAWFGGSVVLGWIDRDPRDEAALPPLLRALDRHADRLGPTTLLEIAVDDGPLLEALIDRGLGIDSVIQVGDPAVALAALDARTATPPHVSIVPLTDDHVHAVVDLHRRVFSAEPAWCWFGAYPKHLAHMAVDLARAPEGHFAVIDHMGRVVGHLGAELRPDDPLWGPVGGLELVLAPELRGHGLARELYRVALTSLVARGAALIKGGTSQPAVMALGRVMRRPWQAFNIRRDVAFGPEHFLRFAPDAVRAAHKSFAIASE